MMIVFTVKHATGIFHQNQKPKGQLMPNQACNNVINEYRIRFDRSLWLWHWWRWSLAVTVARDLRRPRCMWAWQYLWAGTTLLVHLQVLPSVLLHLPGSESWLFLGL